MKEDVWNIRYVARMETHLFGFIHFDLQGLFGHLHLYQLLPQFLVLLLRLCALLLHFLQLMVKSHGHILGNLSQGFQTILKGPMAPTTFYNV